MTLCCHAQEYKNAISNQFMQYTDLIAKKDFERSVEYMNEDFFKIIPKNQMVLLMKKLFSDPAFDFSVDSMKIIRIANSKNIGGKEYAKLQYSSLLRMKFNSDTAGADTASQEEKALRNNLIKLSIEKEFGLGNVRFDATKGLFVIYAVKNAIASSADKQTWKFVVVEEKQKAMLGRFIPKELLD